MAMKIPPDAPIIRDRRLTLIRILSHLTAEKTGRLDVLKCQVKKSMAEKGAKFAESELVYARLQSAGDGGGKQFVDPKLLHELVKTKRITIEQFLGVLCVRTSLMPQILSGEEIAAISKPAESSDKSGDGQGGLGSLFTEFKPDVHVDFDAIEAAILKAVD
jgi:hypothetical protein